MTRYYGLPMVPVPARERGRFGKHQEEQAPETRGNWEPERNILGWVRAVEERTCRYCRRALMHTKQEHDLVYPADRAAQMEHDRSETLRQVEADNKIRQTLLDQGMTEEEAEDELWRMFGRGAGLVEPRNRP